MKGKFIHIRRLYKENSNELADEKLTKITECDVRNPADHLWILLQADMYRVYGDIDNYGIMLITDGKKMPNVEGITSWAGFAWVETNTVKETTVRHENWYLFVE